MVIGSPGSSWAAEGRRQGRLERSLEAVLLEGGRPAGSRRRTGMRLGPPGGRSDRARSRHRACARCAPAHAWGAPCGRRRRCGAARVGRWRPRRRLRRHLATSAFLARLARFGLAGAGSSATAAPTAASAGWLDASAAGSAAGFLARLARLGLAAAGSTPSVAAACRPARGSVGRSGGRDRLAQRTTASSGGGDGGRGSRSRRPGRCGCRCASRSAWPPAGRSGPRGRWPARASARAR